MLIDERKNAGVPASPTGLSSLRDEDALAASSKASIPNADCDGKRHYPSRARAERGMKALRRSKGDQMTAPGALHAYRCGCGQWCVGHGSGDRRPEHRHAKRLDAADFTRGGAMFAKADEIAKARHPDGANASQLGQILREVMAAQAKDNLK